MIEKKIKSILDGRIYAIFTIFLILISVSSFVIQSFYFEGLHPILIIFDITIASIFTIEYLAKIIIYKHRFKYIRSISGIIDLIASIPCLVALIIGSTQTYSWVRLFRLLSLSRVLKTLNTKNIFGGLVGKVVPFAILAMGLKSLFIVLESEKWWAVGGQFNIVLGVIGFSLAALLGAKLSIVNSRIYALEDTICRVVGSMRDMWEQKPIQLELKQWSLDLEEFLKSEYKIRKQCANQIRKSTDNLEKTLEINNVGGPNTSGFHRDVAFLVHRATVKTPEAYDNFLKIIILAYLLALVVGIQGGLGVLASGLSTLILGGTWFLVEDLDDPLNYREESFIDARLDALEYWNESKSQ